MGDVQKIDLRTFGNDVSIVRQLLGSLSTLIINEFELISSLLDDYTYDAFENNWKILNELIIWKTAPGTIFSPSKELNHTINLLKTFLKRAINKNKRNGVIFNSRGQTLQIQYSTK